MDRFTQQVQEWHSFYSTLASVCATLVGLVFVAPSLSTNALGHKEDAELMSIARNTFGHFLIVMMTALVFLVPGVSPAGVAVALLTLGATWMFGTIGRLRSFRDDRERSADSRSVLRSISLYRARLRSFAMSFAGGLGLTVVVGIALALGATVAPYWLMPVLAILLAAATSTAWALLARLRGTPH